MRALLFLLICQWLFAAEYYVDQTRGNDSNNGSKNKPFKTISNAVAKADKPGDVINLFKGCYKEAIHTQNKGSSADPIVIQAYADDIVEIASKETVLEINDEYIVVKNIIFDAQWAKSPVCIIDADNIKITGCEFKNSQRDIITIASVKNVLIENCKIHHGFSWYQETQKEPHGISPEGVKNLTIRGCEIFQITGDCIQVSSTRADWDNVLIEGCTFWVQPISQKEALDAGLPKQAVGLILAENAIDLKADKDDDPATHTIKIKNCSAYGFRSTRIKNAAAFNIKNPVLCTMDGVKSWNNEIAMRLRFPAQVIVSNSLFFENDIAIRYEDDMKKLHILNNTFGPSAKRHLKKVGKPAQDFLLLNNLFVGTRIPKEMKLKPEFNVLVKPQKLKDFFVNPAEHDYHLQKKSPAIDSGIELDNIKTDFENRSRPQNGIYDIGAFEYK